MSARENILAKLRAANPHPMRAPDTDGYYAGFALPWQNETERLRHWAAAMRAVKTEIHWVRRDDWPQKLREVAQEKHIQNIALPTETAHGRKAAAALYDSYIRTTAFEQPLEHWKEDFFQTIDAGFTDAACGIAHTGTLLLLPSPEQPRTLSLIPPVHICLFDAAKMYDHFHAALAGEGLAGNMPTNAVLVSGPSKTADIQLTLAYGAHGPRDLVVLAVLPEDMDANELTAA